MLKVDQVDFEIRLWPLLGGEFVLSRLALRKPEVAVEVGDKEQSNWSLGESPVAIPRAKAAAAKERIRRRPSGDSRSSRGGSLTGQKRKLPLDGTVSTANGKAGAEPQAEL